MIRTHWMTSASAAKAYVRAADYYAATPGRWFGRLVEELGLGERSDFDQFDALADNRHPVTGETLRPHAKDGGRIGLDMTFNSSKSVGIAREIAGAANAGDPRVECAHNEAVEYVLGLVEKDMQCRVRVGGASENRTTGNMLAHLQTHRDTRINADDGKPDMSLHTHAFIFNLTHDPVEGKLKAAEIGQIKHDAPFYEAVYHNRLAANLKTLGYGIERKGKAFEIAGVSRELIEKFSRRTQYIEKVAGKLGIEKPESKAKLGATTRLGKAKELADDLNGYYVSRLTAQEKQQLATLEGRPSRETTPEAAVGYALGHEFERRSVVDEKRVYETALRYGIGSVTPEGVQAEAKRQGLLVKGREATTKAVLAEEARVIAFAREGRGTCRPMGENHFGEANKKVGDLSPDQLRIARHVWSSPDRVILIRGAAGTGKTHTMTAAIAGLDRHAVVLAPSADASRGVLRKEGFADADTVAAFLGSRDMQEKARGGVIWVDEAALMPMRDTRALLDVAGQVGARVVLQGDPKQHRAVARDGNLFHILERFAGLPVAQLTDIRRQRGKYKEAVAAIERGEILKGHDIFTELGWVRQTPVFDHNQPLVKDYLAALDKGKEVVAIAPTHVEAGEVTASIRDGLKLRGLIGKEEHQVSTLQPLHWTEPEKGDVERYDGTEVLQFHYKSGSFKAGDRIAIGDFKPGQRLGKPSTFAVYAPATLHLAEGDRIRITANGWTADKKHRLDNGAQYTVAGFEKDGKIRLTNGWFIAPEFQHFTHGYVATSIARQGKTVDRVLVAMGHESLPAVNMAQFYVSASRARDSATIYTNVAPAILREAIQKADGRKSATELLTPPKRRKEWWLARRARAAWESLRDRAGAAMPERIKQREFGYVR